MDAPGLLKLRDRQIIFSEQSGNTRQRVKAFSNSQIGSSQQTGADIHCLFSKRARFWKPAGVAVEKREIICTFGVLCAFYAEGLFAEIECLPKVLLGVFQITGGVFEKAQPVHTAAGLRGSRCR